MEQLPSDPPPEAADEQLLLPGFKRAGVTLSATDIALYRTCPLKYKFARVLAIPRKPTINQRFGVLVHQVLERFHAEQLGHSVDAPPANDEGSLRRLRELFDAGWQRAGFGSSEEELRFRDRAVDALARYHERQSASDASPVWLERGFEFAIEGHRVRGRVDRVDRLPGGEYELIDYKTGRPRTDEDLAEEIQLPLYRLGARAAWDLEVKLQSYYYVLDDEKVPVACPDDGRVESTIIEVAAGIEAREFEPKPAPEVCRWCDYRLDCPAAAA